MSPDRLDREFFARPTEVVAADLVGCGLFRKTDGGLVGGLIVETEAYGGLEDPASHAAMYTRSRAAVMASPPGTAYVYRSYGIHSCFNVVAKPRGGVGAVLLRAVEPVIGMELMRARRGAQSDRDLCRGPGRLCQAFAISVGDSLTNVVARDDLWLTHLRTVPDVARSRRIGITRAVEKPWRFFLADSPYVSSTRVSKA